MQVVKMCQILIKLTMEFELLYHGRCCQIFPSAFVLNTTSSNRIGSSFKDFTHLLVTLSKIYIALKWHGYISLLITLQIY